MITRFLISVLFGGFSIFGFTQTNPEAELQKILSQPEYRNASIGMQFVDIKSGLSVFEYNSNKLMIPASTLKIVTSAAALEMLGADYRFKTKIGFIGELLENNKLNGDLVLIGGGDPTLGSIYFSNSGLNSNFINLWIQKIKAAGIRQINGNIVLDASIYDSEKVPSSWIWGDIGNYYGAGANAFTCYDNLFRITFKSSDVAGELTSIISTYPEIKGLEITNEVVSSDINSDRAYVFGSPLDKRRIIRGTIPKNKKAFTIKAAIHQPEEIIAFELLSKFGKRRYFYFRRCKIPGN